ncbi:MAG: hypothetical protein WC177_04275 [Bacilli bacterium]
MSKTSCPYCNTKNSLQIIYNYNGINKDQNYNEDTHSLIKDGIYYKDFRKRDKKTDFDGETLKRKSFNRYCPNCNKEFFSAGKMSIIDIRKIILIVGNKSRRYKYLINLDDNYRAEYSLIKDHIFVKEKQFLNDNERDKILTAIKSSQIHLRSKIFGDPYIYESYYWKFKVEYYNGASNCKMGNDTIPENWEKFITPFKDIFNEDILSFFN